MKTTILPLINSGNRSSLRITFLLISLALACFALSPHARAACQEGCLTNESTVLGDDALIHNNGANNTAIGFNALFSNTGGSSNTAVGTSALFSSISSNDNTAIGYHALFNNTSIDPSTAVGYLSLFSNTTGEFNTAVGYLTLQLNTIGNDNTAVGTQALSSNTTGSSNTAIGELALGNNSTGVQNTATGDGALLVNVRGNFNTATGYSALVSNGGGSSNTATGWNALYHSKGSGNIALGAMAGQDLTTGDNNIYVGNTGFDLESNAIRIGRERIHTATYIAGISGATVPTGVAVIVDSTGHLGTTPSSERFKEAVKPMGKASEAILALKPVTFRYKHELDPEGIPQFGLVAEDVEKVNSDLVARDEQGKPYTVRYEAVNAMLLNEFLKEHRKVQELEATVVQQRKDSEATALRQEKQIEALTAVVQKVGAQLEVSKPLLQSIAKNQ